MLMKPRQWLGYRVALNDLLQETKVILDRFEISEIPLDDTFGSSSEKTDPPRCFALLVGRSVEIARLQDILELLHGLDLEYIAVDDDDIGRKEILIGPMHPEDLQLVPYTDELEAELQQARFSADDLAGYLRSQGKVEFIDRSH